MARDAENFYDTCACVLNYYVSYNIQKRLDYILMNI